MELKQLERFLAVYDHGSLAHAARTLGLTQQGISASLANLEDELGARLFDRGPGGVTRPTDCGHALVAHARAQLAADKRAVEELRSIVDGRAGTVTIGVGEAFAGEIIAAAVAAMQTAQPDVRINLVEGYSDQLRHRLYNGEFDFIAAGISSFVVDENFDREPIFSTDDIIVCRAAHPLANRSGLELRDLVGYPWLVPYSRPSDLNSIVDAFVAEDLPPPSRVIGSDAYRIGMQLLVQADLLIMVSPALISTELNAPDKHLVKLDIDRPTITRHASLISPRNRPLSPAAKVLLDEVRKQAAPYSNNPARGGGKRTAA
ncbi:MAG: LysR family transcriptional regulator [Gammaproteobacteria bacterium]|jgi:DNA-binding transcriptional LysR family regulator|nr:LysR family transcriptional regulator [Gammaproteobacteria bacterium]